MSAPAVAKHPRVSRVRVDFNHLLDRIERRLYPETLDTLAFYWLKTTYISGYDRSEWFELDRQLDDTLRASGCRNEVREVLTTLRSWLRDQDLLSGGAPPPPKAIFCPRSRSKSSPESVTRYFVRLLNEWVPKELARLLLEDTEAGTGGTPGIPALAFAGSVERVLIREQLTLDFLERALDPALFSPRSIYPADYEVLRDVILFLLGRTEAPGYAVLPAILVWVSPEAHFHAEYGDAFPNAEIGTAMDGERLHVPITNAQADAILKAEPFRLPSMAVTMDGRLWQSHALATGDRNAVIYRPAGRLRIDHSSDHGRLRLPWPESRLHWSGAVSLPSGLEFFGRTWRMSRWELAGDFVSVELVSTGPLPLTAGKRCRPASVDIAWTSLQNAFERSVTEKNEEAIEKLRHDELIPLGRALYALAECLRNRRLRTSEHITAKLSAVSYHAIALRTAYGPVPCRVLPPSVRDALLDRHIYPAISQTLREVFEGLPDVPDGPPSLFTRFLTRPAA